MSCYLKPRPARATSGDNIHPSVCAKYDIRATARNKVKTLIVATGQDGGSFINSDHSLPSSNTRPASSTATISDHLVSVILLGSKLVDLIADRLDLVQCFFHRGSVAARLLSPALVVVLVFRESPLFGLDLLAQLALIGQALGLVDHLHATGFARAILLLTVLAEVAPLPVAALELKLVVETHGEDVGWWLIGGVSVYVIFRSC